MSGSLPVDLWGWKQGPEAERRGAPPAPALIHQNRNTGIENKLPVLRDEFLAKQEQETVDKIIEALPSRLRKKIFAVRFKIEWMVKTYGINHVGLQTMTIRENVTDRKEFERRFKPGASRSRFQTIRLLQITNGSRTIETTGQIVAGLPAWVLKRKRLRVFQSTKGFLKALPAKAQTISLKEPRKRASFTMDERFERWSRSAVIRQNGKARTVRFRVPYREIFDQLVLSAARVGRYKGSGEIIISRKGVLNPWIQMQNQLLKLKS